MATFWLFIRKWCCGGVFYEEEELSESRPTPSQNKFLGTISAGLDIHCGVSNDNSKGILICPVRPISKCDVVDTMVVQKKFHGYTSLHKILLVGEGDFSFSASLTQALVSAANMVATSLNSEEYLERHYKDAMKNISELRKRGCKVLHEVNAMIMASHSSLCSSSFDRIIYNFPHCGDFNQTNSAIRKNQRLVRLFMENSVKMIAKEGEIHIRHKKSAFFSKWNVTELAIEVGLVLIGEAPFRYRQFQGYNPKYGYNGGNFISDHNFNCHQSYTYKFALPGHPVNLGRQNSKLAD